MNRILPILCLSLGAHAATIKSTVSVTTDRADAIYGVGDTVKFSIKVATGKTAVSEGEVGYSLSEDGLNSISSGRLELTGKRLSVAGTMDRPGFLRCTVTYAPKGGKVIRAMAAGAMSPLEIEPSLPVPDDFDAFWKQQKAALSKVPMKVELDKLPAGQALAFDVKISCLGEPVSGYFAKPSGAKPKSLPIILWVHGAGVRSSSLGNAVSGAGKGMLSMDINAHGSPNGKPGEFYKELAAGKLRSYRHEGREDRDTVYFKGMFLRIVRALDFLTSQPEWDGRTVAVVGHSQGGAQALVAGGLDPRVTFIGTGVPAMCDHTGAAIERINGWPKIVPAVAGKPDPKIQDAARYYDAVNFASRCKAEAIMSVGFIDGTCPPTTCYAAYNQLKGKKLIVNVPTMGHAAPAHVKDAFMKAVLAHAHRK
ncbi:MAG: acetylxylan esterase [Verrucomicrobiia bacterium]|jgi:cephalosporin-C deacetylase